MHAHLPEATSPRPRGHDWVTRPVLAGNLARDRRRPGSPTGRSSTSVPEGRFSSRVRTSPPRAPGGSRVRWGAGARPRAAPPSSSVGRDADLRRTGRMVRPALHDHPRPRARSVGAGAARRDPAAPPATVLDVGGGSGAIAVPLAAQGYRVTVLDPSNAMLDLAGRHAADAGVELRLVPGGVESLAELAPGPFDAVCCHAVLLYLDDPDVHLAALRRVVSAGATLSLLEKNRLALAMRPRTSRRLRRGDPCVG